MFSCCESCMYSRQFERHREHLSLFQISVKKASEIVIIIHDAFYTNMMYVYFLVYIYYIYCTSESNTSVDDSKAANMALAVSQQYFATILLRNNQCPVRPRGPSSCGCAVNIAKCNPRNKQRSVRPTISKCFVISSTNNTSYLDFTDRFHHCCSSSSRFWLCVWSYIRCSTKTTKFIKFRDLKFRRI